MKTFIQKGDVITLTAPAGGVVSGVGYKVGQLFVVATSNAAEATQFEGMVIGVFRLPKAAGAIGEGALVYWNNTNMNVTTTASGNLLIGVATLGGALSGDTHVNVRLNGVASANAA